MNETYKLNIENPCQKANWKEMTISDQARFCSLCDKNVFDFKNWTDEEIINFLNKSDDKICARLSLGQINRIMTIKEKSKVDHWNRIVASALLIVSTNVYATEKNNKILGFSQKYESRISSSNKVRDYAMVNDTIQNIISGTLVKEESRKPIPDIMIEVQNTDLKAKTDSLGNFKILIPENYVKNEIVLMVIAGYGFEGQTQKTIYKNELPITNLIIEKPDELIGEITYYKPKKWWQFWKKR